MANTVINVTKCVKFNTGYTVASTSVAKGATAQFVMNDKDWKYTILITATAESVVTFKQGTAMQGVSDMDVTCPIGTTAITIESGKFKNVDYSNFDLVMISTNQPITVQIVKLP